MAIRRHSTGRSTRGLSLEDLESRNLLSVTHFDINPGVHGSATELQGAVGDNLIVVGSTDITPLAGQDLKFDLWSYSLSDDPVLIRNSIQRDVQITANAAYFESASSEFETAELWKTDGTVAGTSVVESQFLGDRTAQWYATDVGILGSGEDHVWLSNGTSLETLPGQPIQGLWDMGEHVFFARGGNDVPAELWITDGTLDGTKLIRDKYTHRLQIVSHDDQYYFSSWRNPNGSTTSAAVHDVSTGILIEIDTNAVRFASDGSHLYFIDESTGSLNTLNPADLSTTEVGDFTVSELFGADNQLFFVGREETSAEPAGLWGLGSSETVPTQLPLSGDWLLNDVVANEGRILGAGSLNDDSNLEECWEDGIQIDNRATWTSDGTVDGTYIVDVHSGVHGWNSCARNLHPVDSGWAYNAPDFESGWQIRHTDGTADGNKILTETNKTTTVSSSPFSFVQVDDGVLFLATDGQTLNRVFRYDATTQDISPINTLEDGVDRIEYVDGELYAVRDDILWKSVNDEWVPLTENVFEYLSPNRLYFGFEQHVAISENRIAYTNTSTGVLEVIGPDGVTTKIEGEGSGAVSWLYETNGLFLFQWRTLDGGYVLYSTDGTLEGTLELDRYEFTPDRHPFTYPTESQLFYRRRVDELWRTDGTVSGTYRVESSVDSSPLVFGESLLFSYNTPGDTNIWITDGTPNAAQLLGDWPNASGHAVDDRVYIYDRELCGTGTCDVWETDGTPGNTRFAFQVESESGPQNFVKYRGDVYFHTYIGDTGNELWKFDVQSRTAAVVSDAQTSQPSFANNLTSTEYGIFFAQSAPDIGFEPALFQTISTPWHNADTPTDVNGTDGVTPLDAIQVINELSLRMFSDPLNGSVTDERPAHQYDVNNDNGVTPFDALLVVNALNRLSKTAQNAAAPQSDNPVQSHAASDSVTLLDGVFAFEYGDESKEEEEEEEEDLQPARL